MSSLKYCLLCSLLAISSLNILANVENNDLVVAKTDTTVEPQDIKELLSDSINTETFKLPPLSVLFENARNNPSVAILEKEKLIQKKLLSKEKKSWLKFFSARGGYSYGITDNYGTQTDVLTPIFYQYSGIEQTYWNVGGNVNIPIEDLFDIKGKINRQRLNVEKAELSKQQEFDRVKREIIHLYVIIESNIEVLKEALQKHAVFKGMSAEIEELYRNRKTTISDLANAKFEENKSFVEIQDLRSNIKEQIMVLEIIARTEIMKNIK